MTMVIAGRIHRMEAFLTGFDRGVYWPLPDVTQRAIAGRAVPMTFEDVYRKHLATVLRAASRAVGRTDVAEEITADAFLELHRQFDRIDGDRLPGWLVTVVRNRAIDYWRRQQLERKFTDESPSPLTPSAPAPMDANLFHHPALKPIHRVCLTLRYEHELTRDEIAARLGLSETQVRGHLQYGLTLLRKNLLKAV